MKIQLKELATLINGKLHGDESFIIEDAAGLTDATSKDIAFIKDEKNMSLFNSTKAGAVVVPNGTTPNGKNIIEVENPQIAFSLILEKLEGERRFNPPGIHSSAQISKTAKIGQNVKVGPLCIIEDNVEIGDGSVLMGQNYVGHKSKIGKNTRIYSQAVIRERITVGSNCIIHSGVVIGSEGFGYFYANNKQNKIPQIGTVLVEDDVEIGSCTTIDRGTTGATRICQGAKLDNLVHIAHNVEVGSHSVLAAQVGIAGSTVLEEGIVFGGQVGVGDHAHIGKGTQVGAQSGIKGNIKPGSVLFGSPAEPLPLRLKQIILLRKLPELVSDVRKLKEKLLNK